MFEYVDSVEAVGIRSSMLTFLPFSSTISQISVFRWDYGHTFYTTTVFETPICQRWSDFTPAERKQRSLLHERAQWILRRYIAGDTTLQTLPRINRFDVFQEMPIGDKPEGDEVAYHEGFLSNIFLFLQRYYHMFDIELQDRLNMDGDRYECFMLLQEAYEAEHTLIAYVAKHGFLPSMPVCLITVEDAA